MKSIEVKDIIENAQPMKEVAESLIKNAGNVQ